MKQHVLERSTIIAALIAVTTLFLSNTSFAERFHFRVAFESVPGLEDIEAGDIQAGIKVLQYQLDRTKNKHSGELLSTLCAACIVSGSLEFAEHICNKAVAIAASEAAFNNRGVYRALTGDISGAGEDFERVRPRHLDTYMEELKKRDVGLVATENSRLIQRLEANHSAARINASVALRNSFVQNPAD